MRRTFLNLKSQFESNHPFIVPNPPPKILVRISSFNVPNISFLPAIPKEKLPLKIKFIPSIKKLKIGIIIISETMNAAISRGFKPINLFFVLLIKFFKNKIILCFVF